ncbi:MAG: hypothetical protein U0942_15995 [Parvibaculum sp.]|uniref:hypothetical protein n=1 Tax=Parvibaculum sp. TaxID=2024848 RepID=UPI002AB90B39|nr:hypothetical protein [Parvibaculum sp.]MDZ4382834.1 hypothetical protein [Parvibaculum sp.]
MSEPLYQLEEGLGGEVFVCLGGERLVEVPGAMAGTIAEAVERIEGTRGRQIALRWFALGVAAADPAQAEKVRADTWDGARVAPHLENPHADYRSDLEEVHRTSSSAGAEQSSPPQGGGGS